MRQSGRPASPLARRAAAQSASSTNRGSSSSAAAALAVAGGPGPGEDVYKEVERRLRSNSHQQDECKASIKELKRKHNLSDAVELGLRMLSPEHALKLLGSSIQWRLSGVQDKNKVVRTIIAKFDSHADDLVRRLEELDGTRGGSGATANTASTPPWHAPKGASRPSAAGAGPAGLAGAAPGADLGCAPLGAAASLGASPATASAAVGPGAAQGAAGSGRRKPRSPGTGRRPWKSRSPRRREQQEEEAPRWGGGGAGAAGGRDASSSGLSGKGFGDGPQREPAASGRPERGGERARAPARGAGKGGSAKGTAPACRVPPQAGASRVSAGEAVISKAACMQVTRSFAGAAQACFPKTAATKAGPPTRRPPWHSESEDTQLYGVLARSNLASFLAPLSQLGVESVADLRFVTEADMNSMGMTVIQKRKFHELIGV